MKALVLKKVPYGEKDLIVQFYTESSRRLSAFASSARVSRRRFPHQFDFSGVYEIEGHGSEGRLFRLKRCDLLEHLPNLKLDWLSLSRYAFVLEWILWDETFDLKFEQVLQLRSELAEPGRRALAFQIFLAGQIQSHGLKPVLDRCVLCHDRLTVERRLKFSAAFGGILHSECALSVAGTQALLPSSLQALQTLFDEAPKLSTHHEELDSLPMDFVEHQLDVHLKSKKFMKL